MIMKYFSLKCVENAYEQISKTTRDKFWGILGILYSIESPATPNTIFNIDTSKLSTFLENTFRLDNKKNYENSNSTYSVAFSNNWYEKTSELFLIGKPDILPIIIWAYRRHPFLEETTEYELFEMFLNDFHLSKEIVENIFTLNFNKSIEEYEEEIYADSKLLSSLHGSASTDATTIKMNKSFVVANAGDLSRGPFFQPLYAALNTLECLIIFPFNANEYYDVFTSKKNEEQKSSTFFNFLNQQIIFYGAPGTGKSYIINKTTNGESVIRTTFHPDSDYSTFVGCYKPTTKEEPRYTSYGEKAIVIKDINGKELTENRIVYEFVDQAFLQAYIQAWKYYAEVDAETEPKKQYLVIEEINRGNCAQIFGDLFQLLDRNYYGFSDYPIQADNDMKKHLSKAFNGLTITYADVINDCYKGNDIISQVLNGDILLLPNNLYIWASMNTSDQSLFPIDSAFKRRWDWQYMPINRGRNEGGKELDWKISVGIEKYDWWSFLNKINELIASTTNSEDKKLGFFFCKAINGSISVETFVGKVIFYLWNDVFKDFGFDGDIFKDEDGTTLSFDKFYTTDSNGRAIVQKDKVQLFLNKLNVDIVSEDDKENETEGNASNIG